MNVFIAVPKRAQSDAVDRIALRLSQHGHQCYSEVHEGWLGADLLDADHCDAVVLGIGWDDCPFCRGIRHNAVCNDKIIAYESDFDLIDLRTLRSPNTTLHREYRTLETNDGIHVQVKGRFFGLWHDVKTYRYDSDPDYARLLAEELIDKLTDD
ncbi:MAG: hypothetical protein K2K82_07675 [Muribaculaceae bacterium]|nr:hypothetical protein [Muribaculaceae bacterium]